MIDETLTRCAWATGVSPLYTRYHDEEWGVPCHDDRQLFEMLILEGAQAGLSWATVLNKRARYREVFDGFDPVRMAAYGDDRLQRLLTDPGIIRNRLKVEAARTNARALLRLLESEDSFAGYLWRFVDGRPRRNHWNSLAEVPASTPQSDAMSKDLRKRGFKFVGSTICYAFMQAVGMVDDHTRDCFRHRRA